MRLRPLWSVLMVGVLACGEEDRDPAADQPSPADTVAMAASQYDPAHFDTIQWETPEEAVVRGSVVFSYSCAKCHGQGGHGDAGFVMQGDTLRPPSFHDPDWELAEDPAGLRKTIYTGTASGMPHWGLEGLKYRDIDAVAHFVVDLREGG